MSSAHFWSGHFGEEKGGGLVGVSRQFLFEFLEGNPGGQPLRTDGHLGGRGDFPLDFLLEVLVFVVELFLDLEVLVTELPKIFRRER